MSSRTVWGIGTSRTLRVHWALAELGLDYSIEPVRTRTPDTETARFIAVNPRQKIPVLQDGDLTLSESAAIVGYLAERYGGPDSLYWPDAAAPRARYMEWQSFICMELDATSLYVLRRHQYLPEIYGEAPVANNAARDYFKRMIEAAALSLERNAPYLLGEHFSGVDILLTTCLNWAVDYELALPDVFSVYRTRLAARPGYSKAIAVNQRA